LFEGVFHLGDIGGEQVRIEPHEETVRQQEVGVRGIGEFQLLAEGGEGGSQAGASGFEVGIGPEEFDEFLAGMASLEVEREVSQEGGGFLGTEAGGFGLVMVQTQTTQQFDTAKGGHE
jgi:hypothetical protein